jgi:glutathione S-transferase
MWLLEEMGLSYEVKTYAITDGSLRDPAYLMKSPGGRAPALEIDGHAIFESPAITEYLCETRPEHGLGRLAGEEERIPFLQWLAYAETQASTIASLNLQMVFLRPPAKASPVVLKLEVARLRASVKVLEAALGDQAWLLASGFSAADTMMGFNLFAVPFFVDLDPFPAVRAYIDRIQSRPAYQAVLEREGPQTFYAQDFYPVPEV